jgi:hypothetical protein
MELKNVNIDIPEDVHRKAKIAAIKCKTTLRNFYRDALREKIKREMEEKKSLPVDWQMEKEPENKSTKKEILSKKITDLANKRELTFKEAADFFYEFYSRFYEFDILGEAVEKNILPFEILEQKGIIDDIINGFNELYEYEIEGSKDV